MTTNEELLKRIEQLETINKAHEKRRDLEHQAIKMAITQVNYLNKWAKELDNRLDWLTHSHDHITQLWMNESERWERAYEISAKKMIEELIPAIPRETRIALFGKEETKGAKIDDLFPNFRPTSDKRRGNVEAHAEPRQGGTTLSN